MTVFCDNYGCMFIDEDGFCDCDKLDIIGGVCEGSYHGGRNATENDADKRLQAENAKLRELVRDMGELLDVFTECDFACKHYHNGCIGDCYYVNARRELGIESKG